MIIDCISDLHGHYPKLEGGDLLIVAGDLTARDTSLEYDEFNNWLELQNYRKIVLVAGNHDSLIQKGGWSCLDNCSYLCDSGTEFEGLKIWGSPWTKTFPGMNPHCMAFTCETEEELAEKWALIPEDTHILVTHSPVKYEEVRLDAVYNQKTGKIEHVGSVSLSKQIAGSWDAGLQLHVFGHIHEGYGVYKETNPIFSSISVNASHVNERYEPVNKPVRIEL